MDLTALFRDERPKALATLIRLVGDFDLAEDTLQEAFALAVERWPAEGVPREPMAWLVSTARHKAIDRLRRAASLREKRHLLVQDEAAPPVLDEEPLTDDLLRLIFTCCHPALAEEAQIALTLKTLCGLTVEEIARAFLVPAATMAQRLVRAKAKIREARIPYVVPADDGLGERVSGVLRVLYLVFTEGYAPTAGDAALRRDLSIEAIRLARLVRDLLPRQPEAGALVALLLLQNSRRDARFDAAGDLVTLEEQDRGKWDRDEIIEGVALAERALREGGAGFYALQAAIAALHAQSPRADATDWRQIAILYSLLLRAHPSPVIRLNHAAAVAMADGPERGLALIDGIERDGALDGFHLLHAAKADLLRRLGRNLEAAHAYRKALDLVANVSEKRYLQRRLHEVGA
ncbi:MAG TPA: RNA polymerase sigma factor [Candidatus Polarisedimenticolaceae bacterium]|nr:RNA polymerase sigma factor [Candidatus Polarisedimenticolaceae bacterium]